MDYERFFTNCLSSLKKEGRYRYFIHLERLVGQFPYALYYDKEKGISEKIIVWCSNDYLGMGQNPQVIKETISAISKHGNGSGGTRNIAGTLQLHANLEKELASLHQKESALLFSSGWLANHTTLYTLGTKIPDLIFFSDAENHNSIIEGIRHSKAQKHVFRHNDIAHLRELLEQHDRNLPKIIVFESIYSMSGSIAPILDICALAQEFNCMTYIDEVHAVGLYGSYGGGVSEQYTHKLDVIQGTLGKAFGNSGGYITGSNTLVDFIRSHAPGLIFTTSLPPSVTAGSQAAIQYLKKHPELRFEHQKNTQKLKAMMRNAYLPLLETESHILPILIGDPKRCRKIADYLLKRYKIYVQPINYPTVPKGSERLRITVTPFHQEKHMKQLVEALSALIESAEKKEL